MHTCTCTDSHIEAYIHTYIYISYIIHHTYACIHTWTPAHAWETEKHAQICNQHVSLGSLLARRHNAVGSAPSRRRAADSAGPWARAKAKQPGSRRLNEFHIKILPQLPLERRMACRNDHAFPSYTVSCLPRQIDSRFEVQATFREQLEGMSSRM